MQIIIGLLLSGFSLCLLAQDKVAITMGADHQGGQQFVKEQNIHAYKAFKDSGYKVTSFFGDEVRAKEFSKAVGGYARAFTLENVQKSLETIYSKPCSERPKQLMLNFVAHGSRNGKDDKTKKSIPRHSVNGLKLVAGGSYDHERIYADEFADFIKKQKAKEPGCELPELAIFDHSCKSGASTSVFKGLGCVLTSTSSFNSTSSEFIHDTFNRIKSSSGKSMADLHLDLLIKQEVKLINIDYNDGKTILQKIYNNTNQISGCGDESKVNYASYSKEVTKPMAPLCQEFIPLFSESRNMEIDTIQKVISRLSLDESLDKEIIAKIAEVDPSDVPESSELSQNLESLIEEDKAEIDKMIPLAKRESKIMSHSDIEKAASCSMKSGGVSRPSDFSQSSSAKNIAVTICKTLYDSERAIRNCSASSQGKRINIGVKDLFRLKREHTIYPTKRMDGHFKMELSKSGKDHSLGAKSHITYDVLKHTVNDCLKKIAETGSDAQKEAVAFFDKNYKQEGPNCSSNTIACHKAKAEKRSAQIKKYLSYARGYSFLNCRAKLKKSDDLKACEDFKI